MKIAKKILFLFSVYLSGTSTFSQSPVTYAAYGIIPGLGQIILGNYFDGVLQFSLFGSFLYTGLEMEKRKDRVVDPYIDFDVNEAILADYYRRNILPALSPATVPGETATLRKNLRLLKDGKWYEIHPLLEYGNYRRKTYASTGSTLAFQSAQHVWFYSIYSSYRDAGGVSYFHEETYRDLAIAPFRWQYISSLYFWIPVGFLLASLSYQTYNPPESPVYTLLYPGMKKNGYMYFYSAGLSFNAAVGEEAFFRGFLNHYLIQKFRFEPGLVMSSLIFGLLHYPSGGYSVINATIMGAYLGYLHYSNRWDIRQSIAIHFWWNMLIFLYEMRYHREDRNVLREELDVYLMPVYYQIKF